MAPVSAFTNTTKSSFVDNLIDMAHLYGLSFRKLDSFQNTRRDNVGLRKWVLIQNFVNQRLIVPPDATYEPLEWTEEDIKKDEENWLDAQLDGLDEEEDFEAGYVYISRSSEGINKVDTMMITEDTQGNQQTITTTTTTYIDELMDIDEEMPEIRRINLKNNPIMNTGDNAYRSPEYHYDHHLFTTSVDHNYHHWKDKSTIPIPSSSSPLSHKEIRLKPAGNSELAPPPISAYRPFFEPSSPPQEQSPQQQQQQQQQQQTPPPSSRQQQHHHLPHPSLKVPGFFRKYCLDRDYLVGINPAEIGDASPLMNYHQYRHHQQHHHHHSSNNDTLSAPHVPYSTSANAALLNLVKLYHQSADEASVDSQRSRDDICSSIVSSPKFRQGNMAGILENLGNGGIVDYSGCHKITDSSNIWFVGGEEKIDNDGQKMVSL